MHEKVLSIIQKYGLPTTKCKNALVLQVKDNSLTFMLHDDGRELVGFNVVIQGKECRAFEEIAKRSEVWLGILEEHFHEVKK
jgi:hypothetical protein